MTHALYGTNYNHDINPIKEKLLQNSDVSKSNNIQTINNNSNKSNNKVAGPSIRITLVKPQM